MTGRLDFHHRSQEGIWKLPDTELMNKISWIDNYIVYSEKGKLFCLFKFVDFKEPGFRPSLLFYVSGNPDEVASIGFTFLSNQRRAHCSTGIVNHEKRWYWVLGSVSKYAGWGFPKKVKVVFLS